MTVYPVKMLKDKDGTLFVPLTNTDSVQTTTGTSLETMISSKQDALSTQTAYTSKGSATKVPQITTNNLGQVTGITEVTITQPTVNNGTLTIQKNGTNVQTFTANQSGNATANITVPTKVSELTNDSGFITSSSNITGNALTSSSLKPVCAVGSNEANSNGWYKVATSTMSGYGNQNILYFIKAGYSNGCVGLLEMEMRTDSTSISCWKLNWAARHPNMVEGSVILVVDGMTWTMYVNNPSTRYGKVYFTEISNRSIQGDGAFNITYFNDSTKESTTPTATYTSSDGWQVLRAKQDADGNEIKTTYYKANNPNGYTSNTGTITGITMNGASKGTSGVVDLGTVSTTDTKNTAGSTDTSSKIFLIGATSQAANSQTYSDNEVYATSGVLTTKSVQVGGTAATMQYNSTDKCIEFNFV